MTEVREETEIVTNRRRLRNNNVKQCGSRTTAGKRKKKNLKMGENDEI